MNEESVHRIIIAEDSLTQAQLLKQLLESKAFSTELASNGREALRLIRNNPPDLLITDVMMPKMDGYQLCKEIKKDGQLKEVPVLLLTSLGKAEDILMGLECGADKYMMKPYDENLLIAKVKSLLDADRNATQDLVENHQITYGGRSYKLNTSRKRILDMMLSIYEAAVQKKQKLQETQHNLSHLKGSLERTVESKTADLLKKINERRQIESETKLSELKYRKLVNNAVLGVFLSDFEGNFSYINKSFVDLLAYTSAEELMTANLEQLLYDRSDFEILKDRVIKEGKINNLELKLINQKKETRWVLLNLTRIDSSLSGVILDITKKKKIKEKDLQFQEDLKAAKETAEESDRQKTAFLTNMSSEIKRPINALTGFASLLLDKNLAQGQRDEYLAHMKQGMNELSVQINNMLELARLEDSQIKLKASDCHLNKMLDSLYDDWSHTVRLSHNSELTLQLEKGIEDEAMTIRADRDRLNDVLSNLLNNAVRFTDSGLIRFGYKVREKELLFFVKDSGIGIAKENHDLIFDRFKKVDAQLSKNRVGAGLGLTISRALVHIMKGKMWIESEPDKGTSIYFNIPIKKTQKPVQEEEYL